MFSALRLPFLCLLFVTLWSSGWIGAKYILSYGGALGVLAWRYLLVVLVLIVLISVLRLWRKLERREIWHQSTIGLLSHTAYLSLGVAAIEFGVSTGMVALITAMQPLFTLALAYPVLHERINIKQFSGIVLGVFSVILVVGEKISLGGSVLIYSLPLFSVLSLTLASVFCRYSEKGNNIDSSRSTPLLLVLLIQCSAALVGFVLLTLLFGSFSLVLGPELYISMGYMVLAVSIASYFLYFLLLRELPAVKVASLGYLTPPVTMVLGWVWFREGLSMVDLLGLLLAFVAVLMVTRGASEVKQVNANGQLSNRLVLNARAGLIGGRKNRKATRINLPKGVLLLSTVDIEL